MSYLRLLSYFELDRTEIERNLESQSLVHEVVLPNVLQGPSQDLAGWKLTSNCSDP